MGQKDSHSLNRKALTVEQKELILLLNEWDPIGIMPLKVEDEYDCFVQPILELLHGGGGEEDVAEFLYNHLKNHMGLDPIDHHHKEFAHKVMSWWEKKLKL